MVNGYVTFPKSICDKIESVLPKAIAENGLWNRIPLTLEEKRQVVVIANTSKPAYITLSGTGTAIMSNPLPYRVPEVTLDENVASWYFSASSIALNLGAGKVFNFILTFGDHGIPSERTLYISSDMVSNA